MTPLKIIFQKLGASVPSLQVGNPMVTSLLVVCGYWRTNSSGAVPSRGRDYAAGRDADFRWNARVGVQFPVSTTRWCERDARRSVGAVGQPQPTTPAGSDLSISGCELASSRRRRRTGGRLRLWNQPDPSACRLMARIRATRSARGARRRARQRGPDGRRGLRLPLAPSKRGAWICVGYVWIYNISVHIYILK